MGLIAEFKKWWRRDEYIRNLQRVINSQSAMNIALIHQAGLFVSDLQKCTREFIKQRPSRKLCQEIIGTLESFLSRYEQ